MTHPGNEPAPFWFKQVPNNQIHADGFWTRRMHIPHYHRVRRARFLKDGDVCEFEGMPMEFGVWSEKHGAVIHPEEVGLE